MSVIRSKGGMLFERPIIINDPKSFSRLLRVQAFSNAVDLVGGGAGSLGTLGNLSAIVTGDDNAWSQTQRALITPISTLAANYGARLVGFYPQNSEKQKTQKSSFVFGIADAHVGAMTFVGDIATISPPSTSDPSTYNNCIGILQSPLRPNPNNFYVIVNGTGGTPFLLDTGITVENGHGYYFLIQAAAKSSKLYLYLKNLVTDVDFELFVDLAALTANQRPVGSSGFAYRIFRGNSANVRLVFSQYQLEIEN